MSEAEPKPVPTKLRPVLRKHAGKITEPYRIMEGLLEEFEEFAEIRSAKIVLYWRTDWQADVDGVIVGAQCAKASERERLLAEAGGESVDLLILLPEDTWPTLDETEKEHRLYHELCHFAPAKDANGEQKIDAKDRPLWRLKRHPIVAFHSEVERYGVDQILGRNEAMVLAASAAERPMEKIFDQAEANGDGHPPAAWRGWIIDHVTLSGSLASKLREAGIATLGDLSDRMNQGPRWWTGVPGVGKASAEKLADAFEAFWKAHPEFVDAAA